MGENQTNPLSLVPCSQAFGPWPLLISWVWIVKATVPLHTRLFLSCYLCKAATQKKHILGRDGPASPATTKVAYRPKCLSAPLTILYYNYIIVTLYIYYTINILYCNCIRSLFARVCFGSYLFRIPSFLCRCSFRSQVICVVFFWPRPFFGAYILRLGTVLALYLFLFRICLY